MRQWLAAAVWTGLALLAIGAIALPAGLIRFDPVAEPGQIFPAALVLFLVPSLAEETVFRGLLLPRGRKAGDRWRIVLAVALFVAWHPVQALGFGPPWAAMFLEPAFLVAVSVLGILLAKLYLDTGSLWPPVVAHWLVVLIWKLVFGGPLA